MHCRLEADILSWFPLGHVIPAGLLWDVIIFFLDPVNGTGREWKSPGAFGIGSTVCSLSKLRACAHVTRRFSAQLKSFAHRLEWASVRGLTVDCKLRSLHGDSGNCRLSRWKQCISYSNLSLFRLHEQQLERSVSHPSMTQLNSCTRWLWVVREAAAATDSGCFSIFQVWTC